MSAGDIEFKTVTWSGSSDTTILAAVTGKKIAVHGYVLVNDTADATYEFEDGLSGTGLSGLIQTKIDEPVVVPFSPVAWFIGTAATLLNLVASVGTVTGHLIYAEVG